MNLKLAFRRLVKTPFVSLVAIVSLALGIGANAAIFSLFDQTLLRRCRSRGRLSWSISPLRGPSPGSTSCGQAGDCEEVFSYPMFRDLERLQTVFTGIAAHVPLRRQPRLSRPDDERARACSCRDRISRSSACSRRSAASSPRTTTATSAAIS